MSLRALERLETQLDDPGELVRTVVDVEGSDLDFLLTVAGDLEFLKSMTKQHFPSHTEVRLIASVLRRLFVDGMLQSLWSRIRREKEAVLTVLAPDLDRTIEPWPTGWLKYAYAGGAVAAPGLANHSGLLYGIAPKSEIEKYASKEQFLAEKVDKLPQKPVKTRMSVDGYMRSTAVAMLTDAGLATFSRKLVIKYIANRRGGVHFDNRRGMTLQFSQNRSRKGRENDQMSYLLDHSFIRVGHLSGPEYEIVSMAQTIGATEWAEELIRVAGEMAPDDFRGDPAEFKFWTGFVQEDGTGWATSRLSAEPMPEPPSGGWDWNEPE